MTLADTAPLKRFRRRGRLLKTTVRAAASPDATAGVLWVAEQEEPGALATLSATPADNDVFYESRSISISGSATDADLIENHEAAGPGAPYALKSAGTNIAVGVNITASTGSNGTTVHVTIIAEVHG